MDFNKINNITDYIKRVFWFLITIKYFGNIISKITFIILTLVASLMNFADDKLIPFLTGVNNIDDDWVFLFYVFLLGPFIFFYIPAKIFQIFKKLDNVNFFLSLIIIAIICSLVFVSIYIPKLPSLIIFGMASIYLLFIVAKKCKNKWLAFIYSILIITGSIFYMIQFWNGNEEIRMLEHNSDLTKTDIVPAFLYAFIVYKILYYLTKFFPVPFKQIGYVFSIEFLKDLISEIHMPSFLKKSLKNFGVKR